MLKQTMICDYEGDALILMNAARIIREDIFKSKGFNFNGSFPSICQEESLPISLKSQVSMLLRGADQDSPDSDKSIHFTGYFIQLQKAQEKRLGSKSSPFHTT